MTQSEPVDVHGTPVHGVDVDPETRCAHYDTVRDVIAIQFACCTEFYPCLECHEELADHDPAVWPPAEFETAAVLCGACGTRHAIATYLEGDDACPACAADFNPGCSSHHHHYFGVDPEPN